MKIEIVEHEPPYRVGIVIGSLSRESVNRRLADALQRLAPPELEFFATSTGTPHRSPSTSHPRWSPPTRCCS